MLAEGGVDEVVLGKHIAVSVIGVLEVVGGRAGVRVQPELLGHSAETVQAGILIPRVSGGSRRADIGQIDAGLRMIALNDGVEAQIDVGFQHARRIGKRAKPAERYRPDRDCTCIE